MKLDNGLGDVVTNTIKNEFKIIADHLACLLHANERDSWVVGHIHNSDTLFALLVTKDGVEDTVYTDTGTPAKKQNYFFSPWTTRGYDCTLKSSPDSRMLFVPRRTLEYPFHELYKFDRETGKFSDRLLIKDSVITNGLFPNSFPDGAFSPDSKLLYTATGFRRAISAQTDGPGFFWQYDLSNYDSVAIEQSKIYIGKWDRFNPLKAEPQPYSPRMQLAMDGKIYVSPGTDRDTLMSIIQCPNTRGTNCQLQIRSLNLHPTFPLPTDYFVRTGSFFPTLNQTFVRNAGIFQVQANKRKLCQGDTLELSGYGAGAERFRWSVTPALPQTVKVDTLTWQKIATATIPPGSYTFTCQSSSRCGDVYEKSIMVEILPVPAKPTLVIQQKPVPCKGDSVIIQVQSPITSNRYFWNTSDTSSSIVAKQTGLYSLDSISNAQGCGLKMGDTLAISIKNVPVPSPPIILFTSPVNICEGKTATLKAQATESIVWTTGQIADSIIVTQAGWYSAMTKTAEGCQSSLSDSILVQVFNYPLPVFVDPDTVLSREDLSGKNYCVSGLAGSRFSFVAQGGTPVDSSEDCITVNWLPGNISRSIRATETLKEAGCEGTVIQPIRYQPSLTIPNLITPNGDGKNDSFVIQDLEFYPNHHLQIFNRWGMKVLDASNYKNDWKADEGIYFYNLALESKILKGWITVTK